MLCSLFFLLNDLDITVMSLLLFFVKREQLIDSTVKRGSNKLFLYQHHFNYTFNNVFDSL